MCSVSPKRLMPSFKFCLIFYKTFLDSNFSSHSKNLRKSAYYTATCIQLMFFKFFWALFMFFELFSPLNYYGTFPVNLAFQQYDIWRETILFFGQFSQFPQGTCLRPATLLKKSLWHKCFPVNLTKFLRTPFFTEHLWWLLLGVY